MKILKELFKKKKIEKVKDFDSQEFVNNVMNGLIKKKKMDYFEAEFWINYIHIKIS